MVIYEVNLEIEPSVYNEFVIWLQGHMAELIALPGFDRAVVYKDQNNDNCLSVQYHLKSMDAMDHYSTHHAPRLKAEGETKFPNQFKASRRILKQEAVMEA
jgi:hypothetical protein